MPLKIFIGIGAVSVTLLLWVTYLYIRMRRNKLDYKTLETITLDELAPETCFKVLDTDDDSYVIDIMVRCPGNVLEPSDDLRLLKGEKELIRSPVVYEVCETWIKNERIKFLRKLYSGEYLSVA